MKIQTAHGSLMMRVRTRGKKGGKEESWQYTYKIREEGQKWKTKTKYVKKHKVQEIEKAIAAGKTIAEIIEMID